MDLEITGSSHVQSLGLHADSSYSSSSKTGGSPPPLNDNITQYDDRTFDDGFVFMDAATENWGGDTWYWGYNDASQYDPSADTLSFHRSSSYSGTETGERVTIDTIRDSGVSIRDDLDGTGLAISFGRVLKRGESFSIRIDGELSYIWGIEHDSSVSPYEEEITKTTWTSVNNYNSTATYTYDLMGVVPPDAPYSGTYDGPGPLIPNLPSSVDQSQQLVSSEDISRSTSLFRARNNVDFSVDASILEFSAGPRIDWRVFDALSLFAMPGISLNLLSVEADRRETWTADFGDGSTRTLRAWNDRLDDSDILVGVGVSAGVNVSLGDLWFVQVAGEYDFVPEEYEESIGPNTITLDISGYEAVALIGRKL